MKPLVLLLDIGNTHTHAGLANGKRVIRQINLDTAGWFRNSDGENSATEEAVWRFAGRATLAGAALCSVVPRATEVVRDVMARRALECVEVSPKTVCGIGFDYPKPKTIGPDRLANAVAVAYHYGAPSVSVDFGTALTFEVVNGEGNFAGGIIAPGIAMMTEYLHEKTALLPRIKIRNESGIIGKNTKQAMLIGAVHGYRGLVRELILELKRELGVRRLPIVATGGYASLVAAKVSEITAIEPLLTLEGVRLVWEGPHCEHCADCRSSA